MEQIAKYEINNIQSLIDFRNLVNKEPAKDTVKVNARANNAKYIPIGVIENQLDEYYSGLWQVSGKTELIGNSIVCTLHLKVFHPVAKVWLTRLGVGATRLQLNKDEKEMNFQTIKADAFQKGVGAAKSEALKNAAKSLGQAFGRNLNRSDMDDYDFTDIAEMSESTQELTLDALALLDVCNLDEATKATTKKKIKTADIKTIKKIINWLNSHI